jgi:hypothetical protein
VAKAATAVPLAARGVIPFFQPSALAICSVGIRDFCGGTRLGAGPYSPVESAPAENAGAAKIYAPAAKPAAK